jgi:hypothetical protein
MPLGGLSATGKEMLTLKQNDLKQNVMFDTLENDESRATMIPCRFPLRQERWHPWRAE